MDVRARNDEHPGGQVITNDSHVLITIPIKGKQESSRDDTIYYIFIFPIFSFSTTPIRSNSDELEQAPFVVACDGKRIYPAYIVKHGQVHYGFQIYSRAKLYITLYLDINLRFLQASNQFSVYELVQFILYGQDGGHEPLDVKFMVIRHPYRAQPLCRRLDPPRTELSYPMPYFQSPLPQRGCHHPEYLTIGNEINMFYGEYSDPGYNNITISMYPFEIKPHLSYITSRFLRSLPNVTFFGPFWTEILFYSPSTIFDLALMTEPPMSKLVKHQCTQTNCQLPTVCHVSTQSDENPTDINLGFAAAPIINLNEEIEELMDIKVNPLPPDDQVIKIILFLTYFFDFSLSTLAAATSSSLTFPSVHALFKSSDFLDGGVLGIPEVEGLSDSASSPFPSAPVSLSLPPFLFSFFFFSGLSCFLFPVFLIMGGSSTPSLALAGTVVQQDRMYTYRLTHP